MHTCTHAYTVDVELLQHEEENPLDFPEVVGGKQSVGQGEPAPKRSRGLPQPLPAAEAGGHFSYRTFSLIWCSVFGGYAERRILRLA